MRKTLKKKLTCSVMLTVLAALAVVSVCILLGVTRYCSAQFSQNVSEVFTEELLTELNGFATGTSAGAAANVQKTVDAHAAQLGIGSGCQYAVWDASTGAYLGGSQELSVTDNVVTAMNGNIGDAMPLFSSAMDIAIPLSGDTPLVLDIQNDGSAKRSLCANIGVLLLAALVLSLLMCLLLSRPLTDAFAQSAAETAQLVREQREHAGSGSGWESLALALAPSPRRKKRGEDSEAAAVAQLSAYLEEGIAQFSVDGVITQLNRTAQILLGVSFEEDLTFEQVFRGVPMPDETQSMVHGRFTQAGSRLDVVFTLLDSGSFAAVVRLAEREES